MHRFYRNPESCGDAIITLTDREAHHGLHVVRLRRGERVVVLDGAGHEFLCEAADFTRDTIRLSVVQKNAIPALPWRVTLVQGIPKGRLLDNIIQKATELGAHRIVPLLSERAVPQLDDAKAGHRVEHWRAVAIEAIKQCGSAWLPEIDPPATPRAFLGRGEKFDLPLIGSLQPDGRHPREWFQSFQAEHGRRPQTICVWVGPEGDFTPAELNAAKSAGARPITLGRLVLRSETAATYCLSVVNYEMLAV